MNRIVLKDVKHKHQFKLFPSLYLCVYLLLLII